MYYDLEKQYLKILESIKKCGGFPSRYSKLDFDLAFEYAIESVKLRIPVNVTSKLWKPTVCPNCSNMLGEVCPGGYWENPHYDKCLVCGQLLEWEE